MRKTIFMMLLMTLLSGCATTGYDAHYPLCAALPSGAFGCK
jgi:hypothetical protein